MYGFALVGRGINGAAQSFIVKEIAITDLFGHASQFLVHHATGTNVDVTHFGVAHLAIWQTDIHARGRDQGVGIGGTQGVEIRGLGGGDGIELFLGAVAPTIHDDQCQWLLGDRH
jgi:hypothetical protein